MGNKINDKELYLFFKTMNDQALKYAVDFIKAGKIVAFPTETVYGLGADASNDETCRKIFKIKGRPSINPLIVHVSSLEQAEILGEFNEDSYKLANIFWPGPLSIVVPIKTVARIAKTVLAGLSTIALRIPLNYIALELIKKSGVPIAAPSANPSGYISPTTVQHVQEHFLNEKDIFILTDGLYKAQYGIESTIIDATSNKVIILRNGFITKESIEKAINKKIEILVSSIPIKSPGMLLKHYSPKVKVRLNAENLQTDEIGLNFAGSKLNSNFAVNLSITGDLIEAAANLYLKLRLLDYYAIQNKFSTIAVAKIPSSGIGEAINDRLKRAAATI